jgi:hypothetical protein
MRNIKINTVIYYSSIYCEEGIIEGVVVGVDLSYVRIVWETHTGVSMYQHNDLSFWNRVAFCCQDTK